MSEHQDSVESESLRPKRSCQPCTACCTVMEVRELRKKDGEGCKHDFGGGCRIYSMRPKSCRVFECHWLSDEPSLLTDQERPDIIGVIFHGVSNSAPIWQALGIPVFMVREVWKGALTKALPIIERLMTNGAVLIRDDVPEGWLMYGLPEKVEAVKKWSREHAIATPSIL